MIYLASATAFKEHLHSLSKDNLNRLQDAGLISPKMITNSLKGIHRGTGIKYVKGTKADIEYSSPYYIPNIPQIKQISKVSNTDFNNGLNSMVKDYGKDNLGKIATNIKNTKQDLLRAANKNNKKLDKSVIPDVLQHEHLEATTPVKRQEDLDMIRYGGHNSIDVLLKERKHYNQTGGNFFRNKGYNLNDKRAETGEKQLVDQILPVENIRLTNKDYRLAKKKYYKLVKE